MTAPSSASPSSSSSGCHAGAIGDRIGIFRSGTWIVDTDGDHLYNALCDEQFTFGAAGDVPLTGDWTNTGAVDVGVFRSGEWILDVDHDRAVSAGDLHFRLTGATGTVPISGHWVAANAVLFGMFAPVSATFELDLNGDRVITANERFVFGNPGDRPVVGDWNGDGVSSFGVCRDGAPNSLDWTLDRNEDHAFAAVMDASISFGRAADVCVTGDWQGDGSTKIGVFRDGAWSLEKNLNVSAGDNANRLDVSYGLATDQPVVFRH